MKKLTLQAVFLLSIFIGAVALAKSPVAEQITFDQVIIGPNLESYFRDSSIFENDVVTTRCVVTEEAITNNQAILQTIYQQRGITGDVLTSEDEQAIAASEYDNSFSYVVENPCTVTLTQLGVQNTYLLSKQKNSFSYTLRKNGQIIWSKEMYFGAEESLDPVQVINNDLVISFKDITCKNVDCSESSQKDILLLNGTVDVAKQYGLQGAASPLDLLGKLAFVGIVDDKTKHWLYDGVQIGNNAKQILFNGCCSLGAYNPISTGTYIDYFASTDNYTSSGESWYHGQIGLLPTNIYFDIIANSFTSPGGQYAVTNSSLPRDFSSEEESALWKRHYSSGNGKTTFPSPDKKYEIRLESPYSQTLDIYNTQTRITNRLIDMKGKSIDGISWTISNVSWSADNTRFYFDNMGAVACIWEVDLSKMLVTKIVPEHLTEKPLYIRHDDGSEVIVYQEIGVMKTAQLPKVYEAAFVSQTQPVGLNARGEFFAVVPGGEVLIEAVFKNTGKITWKNNGEEEVTMAIYKDTSVQSGPKGSCFSNPDPKCVGLGTFGESYFQHSDWHTKYRIATLKEKEVNPGEVGTFQLPFKVPETATPGRYREDITMAYGGFWMDNFTNGDPINKAHVWVGIEVLEK